MAQRNSAGGLRPLVFLVALAVPLFSFLAPGSGRPGKKPAADFPPAEDIYLTRDEITRLKDLNLETGLCEKDLPQAVLAVPGDKAFRDLAAGINARIRDLGGAELPIAVPADNVRLEDLLAKGHVIALGDMSSNPFIRKLYFQWHCFTDAWYPGEGGYEVRSIHNPCGTGKNVILLGGSDERGTALAAEAFCSLLAPGRENSISVGWTMSIRLGANLRPPSDKSAAPPLLRLFIEGLEMPLGYNEASRAGLMYYYSGDKRYAREFIQTARRTGIIRNSDHYHAHHNALVWDLIEESPVFTDEDRLFVSNELLGHARGPESAGGLAAFSEGQGPLFDRHAALIAICGLCDGRYFARDYPAPEWSEALSAVDAYFRPYLSSFASGSDLSRGIYTYLEALLIYSLLTGHEELVTSGALQAWADRCVAMCDPRGFLVPSGQYDEASYPYFTLRKAAFLLDDPGLLFAAEMRHRAAAGSGVHKLGMEFDQGQAFAARKLEPRPPRNIVGVHVVPLDDGERRAFDAKLPPGKAFSKISFRSGFDQDDQFLLLDGIWGGPPGKPIQDANAILQMTDGGRTPIVNIDPETRNRRSSYVNHNVLSVTMNGEAAEPPRLASLEIAADFPLFGLTQTRLDPYMNGAWDRHIFWRKGSYFFVRDVFRAARAGVFSLESQWRVLGDCRTEAGAIISALGGAGLPESRESGVAIKIARPAAGTGGRTAWPFRRDQIDFGEESVSLQYAGYARPVINRLRPTAVVRLEEGEAEDIAALIYATAGGDSPDHSVVKLGDRAYAVGGDEPAWLAFPGPGGEFERGPLRVRANFVWMTAAVAAAQGLTGLDIGGKAFIAAEKPVDLEWELARGICRLKLGEAASIDVAPQGRLHLERGEHQLRGLMPVGAETLSVLTDGLRSDSNLRPAAWPPADALLPALSAARLPAVRDLASGAEILCLEIHGKGEKTVVLAGTKDGRLLRLDADGRVLWDFRTKGPVHAAEVADILPGRGMALAGSDDEHVYALDLTEGKLLWSHRAEVFPGTRGYPWWTLDGKAKVRSLLAEDFDGDGRPEIAIGTGGMQVEMLGADGSPRWRRPVHYGLPVRLFALRIPGRGAPRLLAGMDYLASQSNLFKFGPDGSLENLDAFASGRRGWDYTGISGLAAVRMTGGESVLAVCRGGAFNDVTFYDVAGGTIRGKASVGDSISGIIPRTVGGGPAALVATEAGWIAAYRPDGRAIWSVPLPDSVTRIWASASGDAVACCRNGDYFVIDEVGRIRARGRASWPAAMLATSR